MTQQLEKDSYIRMPLECACALMKINLSAYESRLFQCISRKTFGWSKPIDRISFTQFEMDTHIARSHIGRALDHLVARHIIICIGTGYMLEYGVNANYSEWLESLPKEVTKSEDKKKSNFQARLLPIEVTNPEPEKSLPIQDESLPIQDRLLPKEVTKSLPKEVNTKERKNIQKNIQKKVVSQTLEEYIEVLRLEFDDLNIDEEVKKCNLWWTEGNKTPDRPKLALYNWMIKARKMKEEHNAKGQSAPGRFGPPNQRISPPNYSEAELLNGEAEFLKSHGGTSGD